MQMRVNKLKFCKLGVNEKNLEIEVESAFEVEICLYDNDMKELALEDNRNFVILALDNGKVLSKQKIFKGVARFQDLKIMNPGKFYLKASSTERESIFSDMQILVRSLPLAYIFLEVPENITTFSTFQVKFRLLNRKHELIDFPCLINIFANSTLFGQSEFLASSGFGELTFYLKQAGRTKMTIFSNFSILNTTTFEASHPVPSLTIKDLFVIFKQFAQSNYFTIEAFFLNTSKDQTFPELFQAEASLVPAGHLAGDVSKSVNLPFFTFANLTILSSGSFFLKVTLKDLTSLQVLSESISRQKFQISKKQAHLPRASQILTTVKIETSSKEINEFFNFWLKIQLFDQNSDFFRNECQVTVMANSSIFGETQKNVSSGESRLELHTKNAESVKLLVSACEKLAQTVELSVLPVVVSLEVKEDIVRKI
jgi:hypothetical protein